MTVYHRLTAEGIETMDDTPIYTFECKVCGYQCQGSSAAFSHYQIHALASTFTKTLTCSQKNDPIGGVCEIAGCFIVPQYVHQICKIVLCPTHVVHHAKHCMEE